MHNWEKPIGGDYWLETKKDKKWLCRLHENVENRNSGRLLLFSTVYGGEGWREKTGCDGSGRELSAFGENWCILSMKNLWIFEYADGGAQKYQKSLIPISDHESSSPWEKSAASNCCRQLKSIPDVASTTKRETMNGWTLTCGLSRMQPESLIINNGSPPPNARWYSIFGGPSWFVSN